MKMEQTECSEMAAYKIQTPGNYPEVNIQQEEVLFSEPVSVLKVRCFISFFASLKVYRW